MAGAFVAGPAWAIDYLEQRARPFIFSTAPPPAVAAALEASLALISRGTGAPAARSAPLASRMRAALTEVGVTVPGGDSPIIPVVIGSADQALFVAERLQARGFDVRAIRPPTVPVNTARLRVSVNLALTEPVMNDFVRTLAATLQELHSCPAVSS